MQQPLSINKNLTNVNSSTDQSNAKENGRAAAKEAAKAAAKAEREREARKAHELHKAKVISEREAGRVYGAIDRCDRK